MSPLYVCVCVLHSCIFQACGFAGWLPFVPSLSWSLREADREGLPRIVSKALPVLLLYARHCFTHACNPFVVSADLFFYMHPLRGYTRHSGEDSLDLVV